MRRRVAITGPVAIEWLRESDRVLGEAAKVLRPQPPQACQPPVGLLARVRHAHPNRTPGSRLPQQATGEPPATSQRRIADRDSSTDKPDFTALVAAR